MSSSLSLPHSSSFKKLIATQVSSQFRAITKVVSVPLPNVIPADHVLIRNFYAGVNASDINYTAGKYIPGIKPPFDTGFEAVSVIIAVGGSEAEQAETKKKYKIDIGDTVVVSAYGTYAEYQILRAKQVINFKFAPPVPQLLPLMVSGLTASIALEQVGEMQWQTPPPFSSSAPSSSKPFKQQTVLVTAAAGATGLFAVQLAKLAGHHVIGTCSNEDKVSFLKNLGVDRVVNYKTEKLDDVLKREYKNGVDIIYESVGGETFDICLRHLAVLGKLIVIGMISGYEDQSAWKGGGPARPHVSVYLLGKSASVRGFFLNTFTALWKPHLERLSELLKQGRMQAVVDEKKFEGVESVADAVDYMYSGKNIGKVVVRMIGEAEEKKVVEEIQKRRKSLKAKL